MDDKDPIAFSVASLVGFMTQQPIVELGIGETKVQVSVEQARYIALDILVCASAAEADLFLVQFATKRIGTDMEAAAVLLKEFREWRETREDNADEYPEED